MPNHSGQVAPLLNQVRCSMKAESWAQLENAAQRLFYVDEVFEVAEEENNRYSSLLHCLLCLVSHSLGRLPHLQREEMV